VLAHKSVNKFIRGIFRVNLKLRSIKRSDKTFVTQEKIFRSFAGSSGGKLARQRFLALYLETTKRIKFISRGLPQKILSMK